MTNRLYPIQDTTDPLNNFYNSSPVNEVNKQERWNKNSLSPYTSPSCEGIHHNGLIVFGTGESVTALDQQDGSLFRFFPLPGSFSPNPGRPVTFITKSWAGLYAVAGYRIFKVQPFADEIEEFYAVDPSETIRWARQYKKYLCLRTEKDLYFIDREGNCVHHLLSDEDRTYHGIQCNPLIIDRFLYFFSGYYNTANSQSTVYVMDLENFQVERISYNDSVAAEECQPVTDGNHIYVFSTRNRAYEVAALKITGRDIPWRTNCGRLTTNFLIFGDKLCFGTGKSLIFLNLKDGDGAEPFPISGDMSGNLHKISGHIFVPGWSFFEVVDPISSQQVYNGPFNNFRWLANCADTVYYYDGANCCSASFAGIFQRYEVDVSLMQDFLLDETTETGIKEVCSYQVELILLDKFHNGRPNEDVRITSSEPTQISINGFNFSIDRDNYAQTKTATNGKLDMKLDAPSLNAPTLFIWSHFMYEKERIVVYPDYQTHLELMHITGPQLQQKRDFKGELILTDDFNDDESADNVATAINNTLTITKNSTQRRDIPNLAYICTHSVGKGIFYIEDISQLDLPLVTNLNWSLDLSDKENGANYQLLSDEGVQEWILANPLSPFFEHRRSGWSIWQELKSGAARLEKFALYAEGETAKFIKAHLSVSLLEIINGVEQWVEHTFDEFIDEVDKAITLTESIFRKVATTLENVIESLSFAFKWAETIIPIHNEILTSINTAMNHMADPGVINEVKAAFDSGIDKIKGSFDTTLNELMAQLNNQSLDDLSKTTAGTSRRAVSDDKVQNGVKQNWMANKVLTSFSHLEEGISFPEFSFPNEFKQKVEAFFSNLEDQGTEEGIACLNNMAHGFQSIDTSNFLASSLGAILNMLKEAMDLLFDMGKAMIDGLLDLVSAFVEMVIEFLNETIQLGPLSKLYKQITGNDLTFLDLMALVVAVPISLEEAIVESLTSDAKRELRGPAMGVIVGILGVFWTACDAAIDLIGEPKEGKGGYEEIGGQDGHAPVSSSLPSQATVFGLLGIIVPTILAACSGALTWAADEHTPELLAKKTLWGFAPVYIATDVAFYVFKEYFGSKILTSPGKLARFEKLGQALNFADGAIFFGTYGFYSAKYRWAQEQPLYFVQQLFANIPPLFKWLRNFGTPSIPGEVWVGVIDGTCDLLSAVFSALDAGIDSSQEQSRETREAQLTYHYLRTPEYAPKFSSGGSGPYHVQNLRYAVSFFNEAGESPLGPWSTSHNLGSVNSVNVFKIPVDKADVARGRRVYRQYNWGGLELVAQIEDNKTTSFTDVKPFDRGTAKAK